MSIVYNGIELEGLDKDVSLIHSISMAAMGHDNNENTDYLDKILEYKRADLPKAQFDEINKLFSVVKMNYQICNGGIAQYFFNGFHEHRLSDDKEVELFDKDTQVETLRKLHSFACDVFPENSAENSKLARIIDFFDALELEKNVPQYETIYSEEDETIWDEEREEWLDNPDYEEPYEECVGYEDEIKCSNNHFYADNFDDDYYQVNEYLEKLIEVYAQFLDKCIAKEAKLGVETMIQDAQSRADENNSYSQEQLEALVNSANPVDRLKAAHQGYKLYDLLADDDEIVRVAARVELDKIHGHAPRFPKVEKELD